MAQQIIADLAANVWKVLVTEGSAIAAGDTVAILESMKMEIPVEAEISGTVSRLAVEEGDLLQEGDLIAEIS